MEWYGLQSKYIVVLEDQHNPEFHAQSRVYRRKIGEAVAVINDILEDIRYIVAGDKEE